MKKTVIQDLNPYIPNERNGTYGGKAGDKEGIPPSPYIFLYTLNLYLVKCKHYHHKTGQNPSTGH